MKGKKKEHTRQWKKLGDGGLATWKVGKPSESHNSIPSLTTSRRMGRWAKKGGAQKRRKKRQKRKKRKKKNNQVILYRHTLPKRKR